MPEKKRKYLEIVVEADGSVAFKEIDSLNDKVEETGEGGTTLGEKMRNGLKKIPGPALTATAALAATAKVIKEAVRAAAQFETGMAEWATISGATEHEINRIGRAVRGLAADIGGGELDEYTQSLYDAESAGFAMDGALKIVRTSAKLGVAGVASIGSATDLVTGSLNAFELQAGEADRVANVMFSTVKKGKTTIDELGGSFNDAAPIAHALGVSVEELGAAFAVTTLDIGNSNRAGTNLRSLFVSLARTGHELDVRQLGLSGTLQKLRGELGDNLKTWTDYLGSQEAVSAAMTLVRDNSSALVSTQRDLEESAGAVDEAFGQINETTEQTNRRLKNELASTLVNIGEQLLPVVNVGLETLIKILRAFSRDDEVRDAFAEYGVRLKTQAQVAKEYAAVQEQLNERLKDKSGWSRRAADIKDLNARLEALTLLSAQISSETIPAEEKATKNLIEVIEEEIEKTKKRHRVKEDRAQQDIELRNAVTLHEIASLDKLVTERELAENFTRNLLLDTSRIIIRNEKNTTKAIIRLIKRQIAMYVALAAAKKAASFLSGIGPIGGLLGRLRSFTGIGGAGSVSSSVASGLGSAAGTQAFSSGVASVGGGGGGVGLRVEIVADTDQTIRRITRISEKNRLTGVGDALVATG